MTRRNIAATTAFAVAVSLGALGAFGSTPASAEDEIEFEKCYGVVKAGHNDCQTATSSCAGTSKADNQLDAWVYLPEGSCGKIAGGNTEVL
ncbi:MAG: DUF2282 domain-containing protein [Alphaproteobacteria bacterium]